MRGRAFANAGVTVIEAATAIGIVAVLITLSLQAERAETTREQVDVAVQQLREIEQAAREYWRYDTELAYKDDFYQDNSVFVDPPASTQWIFQDGTGYVNSGNANEVKRLYGNFSHTLPLASNTRAARWGNSSSRWPDSIQRLVVESYLPMVDLSGLGFDWARSPWGTPIRLHLSEPFSPSVETGTQWARHSLVIRVQATSARQAEALVLALGSQASISDFSTDPPNTVRYAVLNPLQVPSYRALSSLAVERKGLSAFAGEVNMNGFSIVNAGRPVELEISTNGVLTGFPPGRLEVSQALLSAIADSVGGAYPVLRIGNPQYTLYFNELRSNRVDSNPAAEWNRFRFHRRALFYQVNSTPNFRNIRVLGPMLCDAYVPHLGTHSTNSTTLRVRNTHANLMIKNYSLGNPPSDIYSLSDIRAKQNVRSVSSSWALDQVKSIDVVTDLITGRQRFSDEAYQQLGDVPFRRRWEEEGPGGSVSAILWQAVGGMIKRQDEVHRSLDDLAQRLQVHETRQLSEKIE